MEKIDITSNLERLDTHLKNNMRTILSARFGDGKSYFLNEYIVRHQIWKDYTSIEKRADSLEDTYFVVLHPIKYSVAKNEDVFEYIKRDILVQLYQEKKIDDIDYKAVFEAIKKELKEKALPMLGDLVSLFPGGNVVKSIIELGRDIKNTYDEKKHTAVDFIDMFVKQKGGIYEDDAYTQMIRKTLEHLKEPHEGFPARKVLVIEDLDRLDPAHLFRILNVLGAHIDDEKETNKFGFDNIVLVLDYDATESIFYHFYGEKANYEGYMDKFNSSHVYRYSISQLAQKALVKKIENETDRGILDILVDGYAHQLKTKTLYHLIEELSVRKVEQIYDHIDSMWLMDTIEVNGKTISTKAPITYLLALLTLMNQTYKRNSIFELFDKAAPTLYCGQFVYAYPDIENGVFLSNDNHYWLISPIYDGDTITGIKTIDYSAKDKTIIRGTDVLRAAWKLAESVILDADKIKMIND